MPLKQIILLVACLIALKLFFSVEIYSDWVDRYLMKPDVTDQYTKTDIKERFQERFGSIYQLIEMMHTTIDTSTEKNNIILLPPNTYLQSLKLNNLSLPEPAVFYYLSGFNYPKGFKTVWTTSPDVENANWAIIAVPKRGLSIVKIKGKDELHQLLNAYKNYIPAL